MLLKCKMCGGDMEYTQGASVMECPYCGTNQTLPKVDDERLGQMHSRANHLRLLKEFDKAQMIYEEIIAENPKDAEAHWCALLCRYGIEYVEDPYSRERKPTMHRTQFDAITEDAHYLSAVEHADSVARELYEHEAQLIDRIRRRYLSIASKEEPFDVFICYKETGADGQRTKDSVYAQEIYNELTREGYKVFFARITLEDKLGEAYEPYIFAALGSARVMLVVGTSAVHMQAEWVKNEWKRYLYLMKQDSKKKIIPVYRDMEAYDMPEEFVYMQAQDYGKIGALQDLVRGVEKIVGKIRNVQSVNQVIYQTSVNAASGKAEPLVRRGMMYLEDGDWSEADQYFDRALDEEPENAQAYIGRLMVSLRCLSKDKLREIPSNFKQDKNYLRAVKYADGQTVSWLTETADHAHLCAERVRLVSVIKKRFHALRKQENERKAKEAVRIHRILSNATEVFNAAKLPKEYNRVKVLLEEIGYEPRAQQLVAQCDAKIEEFKRREEKNNRDIYETAVQRLQTASRSIDFYEIKQKFQTLGDYRNSKKLAQECEEKEKEAKKAEDEQAEAERKAEEERREQQRIIDERNRQIAAAKAKKRNIVIVACVLIGVMAIVAYSVLARISHYEKAQELLAAGNAYGAAEAFEKVGAYSDAQIRARELYYAGGRTFEQQKKPLMAALAYRKSGQKDALVRANGLIVAGVSAGNYHTVGMKADGTVVAVGDKSYGRCDVSGWKGIVAVSAGEYHTVGMKADGTVVAVGDNDDGQCDVNNWKDIVAVSAGDTHTVGLKADGTVVAVGSNYYSKCDVSGWTDIVAVSAGDTHTVGMKADGTVVAVGSNLYDMCDVSGWKDIVAVSAGDSYTVGLKSDGTVVAVGDKSYGQCDVGGWKDIVAVSAGRFCTVGLKADGTVVAVGYKGEGQCNVSGWNLL